LNDNRRGIGIGAYHFCIILLFILALTPSVAAADTMFRANADHLGVFNDGGIVTINAELWRFKTGGAVYSSPAVSNGVVYVGSDDNNLYAIDAVTGKEKWRFATGDTVLSSPAVLNGVVYVGSDDNNLYAIDAVTGKEKWRFVKGDAVYSSPAVSNGVVYVGSDDNNLYAIDAVTGKEKWRFATIDVVSLSPAILDGVVYIGSYDKPFIDEGESCLYAIDAVTGKEKWRFTTGDVASSSPAVSNGVVYIAVIHVDFIYVDLGDTSNSAIDPPPMQTTQRNGLYAIDAVTGRVKWFFKTGSAMSSSPAVFNGVVYVGSDDNNTYAIDAVTGTGKWGFKTGGAVSSSPAVSNGIVYVGSDDNNLYAIDAVTGKEKWRFATGGSVSSSPAVSNGIVYVGSGDGSLYAIGQVSPSETSTSGIPTIDYTHSSDTPNPDNSTVIHPLLIFITFVLICSVGYGIYRMKSKSSKNKPLLVNKPFPQLAQDKIPSPQGNDPHVNVSNRSRTVPADTPKPVPITQDSLQSVKIQSTKTINHHDVFITYSTKDKPVADAVCAELENHDIRCWIAPRDVLPGEDFPKAIIKAINGSKIMVLIFSADSNSSPHVIRELTKAVSKGVIIIPFRIEDVALSESMEYLIGLPHWLDAITPPLEKHIDKLVKTVDIILNQE
jgi:outer membrane protein assembly factor BamB